MRVCVNTKRLYLDLLQKVFFFKCFNYFDYYDVLSGPSGDLGADLSDARRLIVTEFAVAFSPDENRPDIIHHLDSQSGIVKLSTEGIKIKEGAKYKFRIAFRVQVL